MRHGTARIVIALAAAAVAFPVAYAIAQDAEPETAKLTPASECDPSAVEAFTDRGFGTENFYPGCPSVEDAESKASQFHADRRRHLTYLVETIKAVGTFPEHQADLDEAQAELEKLGGPDPAEQTAAREEAQNLMTEAEWKAYREDQLAGAPAREGKQR
ncbi:MAG: hypothetical protein R2718_04410 [Solirubrobacterales bacterium]